VRRPTKERHERTNKPSPKGNERTSPIYPAQRGGVPGVSPARSPLALGIPHPQKDSMTYYRIRNWQKHFENNRTKEMVVMRWVPVPNKHDGEGYQTIMSEKDGITIYGCWHLILQVASKCGLRGTLLRDDGTPYTAKAISLKTGWRNERDIQRALDFLSQSQVAWLEVVMTDKDNIPQEGAGIPQEPARKEGKEGKEEKGTPAGKPSDAAKNDTDFWPEIVRLYSWVNVIQEKNKMQAWLLTPKGRGRKLTRRFVVNWLNKCDGKPLTSESCVSSTLNDRMTTGLKNAERMFK